MNLKMSKKVEQAMAFHDKGYNCAQAVACSFCEEFGIDQEDCEKKTVLGRRSVMIDPGEIYTLTELSERVREVTEQGKGIILCRQRKETEDAALVDAAVAFGIGQMKLGSPGCLEAAVKYNRLLKLEEKLGKSLGTDCP